MTDKCVIGIDFGTLSARAVVIRCFDGNVLGTGECAYPHGVISGAMPDGTQLPPGSALQDPADYIHALRTSVREALASSAIPSGSIIGIGIDATSCTILPVTKEGVPLCFLPAYQDRQHAYAKLWKHHAAAAEAEKMTELARSENLPFLSRFGDRVSSEGMFPKLLEILREDPEIYREADAFLELGDYLTGHLTGCFVRSLCMAGFKSFWEEKTGYPPEDFLAKLDPHLRTAEEDKLRHSVMQPGARAGYLTEAAAEELGLLPGIPVAVPMIDAHAAVPGAGITGPGELLLILGTSSCSMICDMEERSIPGICGVVKDGILPGFYGYEAGQTGVGDCFAWFVKNAVPEEYTAEARKRCISVHTLLMEKAAAILPGRGRLIALDWWNGNRSILNDASLSGVFFGLTLETKPEEMYRALLEATAFGARKILENFEANGVQVRSVTACGGISEKNPLMMQIYADVFGKSVTVHAGGNASAMGAAMLGAVCAGSRMGGYDTLSEASSRMAKRSAVTYEPVSAAVKHYDALYRIYSRLYELLGVENRELFVDLQRNP